MPDERLSLTRDAPRLLLTLDRIGGVWRYALDLAESLRGRVLCLGLGFGPPPDAAQIAEAEGAGLRLAWRDLPLDWQDGGLAALPEARRAVLDHALRHGAQALHLDRLALADESLRQLPIVTTGHSCLPTWWATMRAEPLPDQWEPHAHANRRGLAASHVVAAPSMAHAQRMREAYGARRAIRVIPNAARMSLAEPAPKEPFAFAAARWWDEAKNARVLDAAAGLACAPVRAAGATQAPGERRVAFRHAQALGALTPQETRALMRRAAVFISPSIYEPFGIAALEAAAEGCALALADIPGYREIWGDCALFFDPLDPGEAAAALNALLGDEALRARMALRAMQRARRHSLRRQAEAVLAAHADARAAFAAPAVPILTAV